MKFRKNKYAKFLSINSVFFDRKPLIMFIFFVLFSSGAPIALRYIYAELQPFYSTASRFIIASMICLIIMRARKIPIPNARGLIGAVIFGLLALGISGILLSWGLVKTPASVFQILMAPISLLTLFLAYFHGQESLSKLGIIGAILAMIGIFIIVYQPMDLELSYPHIISIIIGSAFMAEGNVIVKQYTNNHPLVTNAFAMPVGAIVLIAASIINGEKWVLPSLLTTWFAYFYILIFVTLIAFVLYLKILESWTASRTSYGFIITPIVTILLASLIAEEKISLTVVLGTVIVLLGVIIGSTLKTKSKPKADFLDL